MAVRYAQFARIYHNHPQVPAAKVEDSALLHQNRERPASSLLHPTLLHRGLAGQQNRPGWNEIGSLSSGALPDVTQYEQAVLLWVHLHAGKVTSVPLLVAYIWCFQEGESSWRGRLGGGGDLQDLLVHSTCFNNVSSKCLKGKIHLRGEECWFCVLLNIF